MSERLRGNNSGANWASRLSKFSEPLHEAESHGMTSFAIQSRPFGPNSTCSR